MRGGNFPVEAAIDGQAVDCLHICKEVYMVKRFNWSGYGPIILSIVGLIWSFLMTPLMIDDVVVGSCLPT